MRKRIAWLISCGLVAGLLATPGIASAHTNEAIAETGGFALTLPGVGLNVDVMLDDYGNIESVDVVDPGAEEATAEEGAPLEAHKVRFEIDEDGTRLSVMAKKHKLTSKVQAGTLEALLGAHEWSAVLFEDLSTDPTVVAFTVGVAVDGTPALTGIGVTGLSSEAAYTVVADEDDDDDAVAVLTFTWDGFTKVLKIRVDVDDDDEDDDDEDGPSAVLKIELRAKDRQRLQGDLDTFVGPHSWDGLLCDGTPVTVAYTIEKDGSLTLGEVTPVDGFTVKEQESGFQVRFDGSKARLHVKFVETDDGSWDLKVDAKTTEKCKHDDDDDEREIGKQEKPRKDRDDRDDDDDDSDDEDDD